MFACTFAVLLAGGLAYNYSRPAIYLARTLVQINPGSVQVESALAAGGTQGADAARSLQSELQVLTSRPLLEIATAQLSSGSASFAALQAGLEARAAEGTNVVALSFRGPDAEFASSLVNAIVAAYKKRLDQDYQATTGDSVVQNQEEVERLQQRVVQKRGQIEEFRLRHNIVSLEREENDVLGRIRGQTDALTRAQERLAAAEGKLRSARQTLATARPVGTAQTPKVNAALAGMEQRASALREELADLSRQFTKAYLDIDPQARVTRARLDELERQIVREQAIDAKRAATEQQVTRSTALTAAEEEVTAARDASERLQAQTASNRSMLQQFSARFNEYRNLSAELAPIEALLRDAMQRKARLETGELGRRPSVRILEPAFAPSQPWQPDYTRDAWVVAGASLALALLAMWIVELFNKQDVQPTMVMAQPTPRSSFEPWHDPNLSIAMPGNAQLSIDATRSTASPGTQVLLAPDPSCARELRNEEIAGLLDNCGPPARLFSHLMLRGLSADESLALQSGNLSPSDKAVAVGGLSSRTVPLDAGFFDYLASIAAPDGVSLVAALGEKVLNIEEMGAQLLYAAHDAEIEQPSEVTPEALRHTCAAHLARQGIRLSELATVMGPLDTAQARNLSALAPAGRRLNLHEVERVVPAAAWTLT